MTLMKREKKTRFWQTCLYYMAPESDCFLRADFARVDDVFRFIPRVKALALSNRSYLVAYGLTVDAIHTDGAPAARHVTISREYMKNAEVREEKN